MKRAFLPLILFFFAASVFTASAQDTTAAPAKPPPKKAAGRPAKAPAASGNAAKTPAAAAKKKPVKKKPAPVSEYKFNRVDSVPAYKFDKRANPIIKKAGPRKKAAAKTINNAKPPARGEALDQGKPIPRKKLPEQPPTMEGGN